MKNLQFFQIFKEISRFFQIFLKVLSHFWRKFGQEFRKFWNIHLDAVPGCGGETPDASEFMEIRVEKSMETCDFE